MKGGSLIWRGLLLLLWVGLLAGLLGRDYLVEELRSLEIAALERGRETSFSGVYFQGERIGFVRSRLGAAADNRLLLEQDAYLLLNILGENHPVRMQLNAHLSMTQELLDFQFTLLSPFASTRAIGRVAEREILLELETPRGPRRERIRLREAPRIATPHRAYLLGHQPEVGSRVRVNYFDPVSLAGNERILEYRGRDRVLIANRIHNLHHFHETVSGMRINIWLDETGRVIKEESPAGFVFLAEPEFRATDIPGAGPEILTTVAVPLSGRLPDDLTRRPALTYHLLLDEEAPPDLLTTLDLTGGPQHLEENRLTIQRQQLPPPPAIACLPAQNGTITEALAATPHVQSDDPHLAALAREIAGGATDDLERLRRLADWVYENIDKRPVLGIPDALSVMADRVGDCNEHAVLLAALARSQGLPTRIAAGLLFQEGIFLYHAWNEVCLDGRWLGIDATINQFPTGLTHIRLITGETKEMARLGAILGRLSLAVMEE
ncbi:transglutaminase family protein [Desulfurivibrio sp. D14AmB]|uniref:transglutaminase-like domain-containing protein n=1 Tax=Desulfurivibrio sp. D14AmB TaxID=3374370 RepID=UPI00376F1F10